MLELICACQLTTPSDFPNWLVIIRSLRQARAPQLLREQQWWEATVASGTPMIHQALLFIPPDPEKPESYLAKKTAIRLLEELYGRLEGRTPGSIVLIGHGFGGYVIKKALTIAHNHIKFNAIYNAILAIAFVGTVRNDEEEGFDDAILISAAIGLRASTGKVKSKHQGCLSEAKNACAIFRTFQLPCSPTAFCETRDTPYNKYYSWLGGRNAPVSTKSLGSLQTDTCIVLDFDHEAISGYPWENNLFEAAFREEIQRFLSTLGTETPLIDPLYLTRRAPQATTLSALRRPVWPRISLDNPCHVLDQNPHQLFVGRGAILKHIEESLSPATPSDGIRKFAVVGLGGMGKTQVALKYAYKSQSVFTIILWANADTPGKLAQSFSVFDQALGLSKTIESRQRGSCLRVKEYLRKTDQPWLLVFDNVSPDVSKESWIDSYWPSGENGSLLITTREAMSLGPFTGKIEELSQLLEPESAELILSLSGKEKDRTSLKTAAAICSRLGCYPLAILTAASILKGQRLELETFLKDYGNSDLLRYQAHPMSGPEARCHSSLETALRSQFARLDKDKDKDIRRALGILSCLDHSGIEEKFLEGVPGKPDTDSRLHSIRDIKRVRTLVEKNLVRRTETNDDVKRVDRIKISMHQLIQDFCLMDMKKHGEFQEVFSCAVELICNLWPVPERHNRHNRDLWITQQNLIQHIEALAKHCSDPHAFPNGGGTSLAFAELCYNGAWYFYERGNFKSARPLLETAENICKLHKGSELILADIYGAYGSIDSESNDRESCKDNFDKQLKGLQVAIEKGLEKQPTVREALSYGGLANATMGMNQYAEAEELYKKCLEVWDGCPGDPDIYVPHFAACLTLLGKVEEAEERLKNMIEKRKERYGDKDLTNFRPGIAHLALGNTYIRQGRFDEAEQAHLTALQIIRSTLGEEHHRYADVCYKVGWHLERHEKYPESIASLNKSLEIYEKDTEGIYRNEAARTCFLMGRVSAKLVEEYTRAGNVERSNEWAEKSAYYNTRATELRRMVPLQPLLTQEGETETGYDDLVMFWSR